MKNKAKSQKGNIKIGLPVVVIISALIIAILAYNFVFGNSGNFQGNDPANQPIPGNYFGTIYSKHF
jgi:biopolymer transport protein ExbB